jgi:hypothetical protein
MNHLGIWLINHAYLWEVAVWLLTAMLIGSLVAMLWMRSWESW